ncbi:DEAD box RNA helicase family protein [Striga asiatica]|uniref:RNA helicase n=1 Tax=Striga asiatica TaxID=4170 RepID=A0A5A7RC15_STRAF|nr:DEAD box RNA helicase family protein [Striga asiatica]
MHHIMEHVGRRSGARGDVAGDDPKARRAKRRTMMVYATVPFSLVRVARSCGCNLLLIWAEGVLSLESVGSGPEELEARVMKAFVLHDDLGKFARSTILKKLRHGDIRVLLTNELSARGLDIQNAILDVRVLLTYQPDSLRASGGTNEPSRKEGYYGHYLLGHARRDLSHVVKVVGSLAMAARQKLTAGSGRLQFGAVGRDSATTLEVGRQFATDRLRWSGADERPVAAVQGG